MTAPRNLRVLVADDDPGVATYLVRLGRCHGLLVDAVSDGIAALARMREHAFDLFVLDLVMPGLSGIDTLRQLRAECNRTPVLIFTGYSSIESALEAGRWGAVSYREKALRGSALIDAMRAAAAVPDDGPSPATRASEPSYTPQSFVAICHFVQRLAAEPAPSRPPAATIREMIDLVVEASVDGTVTLPQFAGAVRVHRLLLESSNTLKEVARNELPLIDRLMTLDSGPTNLLVEQALTRLRDPHSLQEKMLADEFDRHSSTIGRHLYNLLGFRFRELRWATMVRPSVAPLARSSRPIRHIAVQCGYDTHDRLRQFDRDFKYVLGLVPSEFRRSTGR